MTEEKAETQRSSGWKWAALVLGGLLAVILLCGMGLLWGGVIGFAIGRGVISPGAAPKYDDGPYDEQIPSTPEWPEIPSLPYESQRPWLGVTFVQTEEGARVTQVIPGSPADTAGLQEEDIITAVDGQAVTEARPLDVVIGEYTPGDRVVLTVLREGRERTIRVRLASRMEMMMPEEDFFFQFPDNGGG